MRLAAQAGAHLAGIRTPTPPTMTGRPRSDGLSHRSSAGQRYISSVTPTPVRMGDSPLCRSASTLRPPTCRSC